MKFKMKVSKKRRRFATDRVSHPNPASMQVRENAQYAKHASTELGVGGYCIMCRIR